MLHVYVGPMYAGKTTKILDAIKQNETKKVVVIQWQNDNRDFNCQNHDGDKITCPIIKTLNITSIMHTASKFDVICIDDAHFFDDLYISAKILLQHGKELLVCGLDGDYLQSPFQNVTDLAAISTRFEKLNGYCSVPDCGNPSIFTIRKSGITERILPGNDDIYKPVCREHFKQNNLLMNLFEQSIHPKLI